MLMAWKYHLLLSKTKHKILFVKYLSFLTQLIRYIFRLPPNKFIIQRKGITWQVNLNEAIDYCLFLTGEYEPELFNLMAGELKEDDIVIDIGCNIGAHTIKLAQHLKTGHVYAIEPTDFAFDKLIQNINLNPTLKNRITASKAFMNGEDAVLPKSVSSSWDIRPSINSARRNKLDVGIEKEITNAKNLTLDKFIQDYQIKKLDAIKLDVDGHEINVLKGAREVIEKFSPKIFIEFAPIHFNKNENSFKELIALLNYYGYTFKDTFGNNLSSNYSDIVDLIPHGSLLNVLAERKIEPSGNSENSEKLKLLKQKLSEYMAAQSKSWSFLKVMKPGYASKYLYAIYMIETYHYTFHNSRNQAAVATRNENMNINYMKFCLHHAEEEVGHELMALHDIKNLGFDIDKTNLPEPLNATKDLINYLYEIAHYGNPLARLGYSFWAERVYAYIKPLLTLMRLGVGIKKNSMTFFNEHSDIDAKHAEEVDQAILRFAKTEEDWKAIEDCMTGSLDRTIKMTHEVLLEYDNFLSKLPSRYSEVLK